MRNKLTGLLMALLVAGIIFLAAFPQYATGTHRMFGGGDLLVVEKAKMDSVRRANLLLRMQLWYGLEVGDTIKVPQNDTVVPLAFTWSQPAPNTLDGLSHHARFGPPCEIRKGGRLVVARIDHWRFYTYVPPQASLSDGECDPVWELYIWTHEPPIWYNGRWGK